MAWVGWIFFFTVFPWACLYLSERITVGKLAGRLWIKEVLIPIILPILLPLGGLAYWLRSDMKDLDVKIGKVSDLITHPKDGLAVRIRSVEKDIEHINENFRKQTAEPLRSKLEGTIGNEHDRKFVHMIWPLLLKNPRALIEQFGTHPLIKPHIQEIWTLEYLWQPSRQFEYASMPPK